MSEISSGLVAVAWIHTHEAYPKKVSDMAPGYWGSAWKHDPLIRLSDAEAIIAQKDAEINKLILTIADHVTVRSEQSERIKELESDVDEEAHIRDRMAKLLAETAVALKGPEKALHRHGWQSAALKLAKDAIVEIAHVPVGTVTTSYDMRRIALAAIDALGE